MKGGTEPSLGAWGDQSSLALTNTAATGSINRILLIAGSTGSTGQALLNFGDADDLDIGGISYDNSDNSMAFKTNNAEWVRITNAGNVGIGTTNPGTNILNVKGATAMFDLTGNFTVQDVTNSNSRITLNAAGNNPAKIKIWATTGSAQGGLNWTDNSGATVKWQLSSNTAISGNHFEINEGDGTNNRFVIKEGGNVGIGTTSPTAVLHLKAGTTAASTAPLKFTSGSLLTTAEAGAVEFLTDAFYGTITTGAARKTFAFLESPAFTTPNLGTPSAGTLTNCTGLPVAGGGTGVATLGDAGVLIGNGTGAVQVTGAGTSGQVLTSNGAGVDPTFQAATGGATPEFEYYNSLSNSGETNQTLTGGGVTTFSTTGLTLDTSGTATSAAKVRKFATNGQYAVFASNSYFSVIGKQNTAGTGGEAIFGVGQVTVSGSAITYTVNQYSFKLTATLGTLSATNANGTTETATASGAVTLSNAIMYHAKKTGTTNIKFYTDRTLQATHTTNLPTGNNDFMGFGITNTANASQSVWELCAYKYNQDAE